MKALYTILFFLDTLALVLLAYFFFKLSDKGISEVASAGFICAIIICTILLMYIMVRFIKLPGSKLPR